MSLQFMIGKFFVFQLFIYAFPNAVSSCKQCPDQIYVDEERNIHQKYDPELIYSCSELGKFECRNGACIPMELLCDGRADCSDQSDETQRECERPELSCPRWSFRCDYGACVHEDAKCNGVQDCVDNSDELLDECPRAPRPRISPHRRRLRYRVKEDAPPSIRGRLAPARSSPESAVSLYAFCLVPQQPINGQWKLHRSFCKGYEDCDIPQGVALKPGSRLTYSCAPGFKARGSTDVYCGNAGNWSSIPICVASACTPLNSISRAASCSRFGDRVSCQNPVLPYTRARITCRYNYGPDGRPYYEQEVECTPEGRWEPEPMGCIPVCGMAKNFEEKTATGAFPWHANVWREIPTPQGPRFEFRCSATIIERNLVLTAAHCVLNEKTGLTDDPRILRVTARNNHGLEGVEQNNPWTVLKVKQVFRYCQSLSLANGYSSDIALIRLLDPLEFSRVFLPACLDISSLSEEAFQPGARGTIAGFGRTFARTSSPILQTAEVIRVEKTDCGNPSQIYGGGVVVTEDELCAVYSNETRVCDWDSGGGLVAKVGNLWHLRGIFSVGFTSDSRNGGNQCGSNPYSIYTKTSTYMPWIQDVLYQLQRYGSYSPCSDQIPPLPTDSPLAPPQFRPDVTTPSTPTATDPPTTTPIPTTTTRRAAGLRILPNENGTTCLVPPQPANGEWKLHPDLCEGNTSCDLPETAAVRPGIGLVYSCAPGFRIMGNPNAFCSIRGGWSALPTCVEITCSSLESVSRSVNCFRSNIWTLCNATILPETRAELSCRLGYREDTDFSNLGSRTVRCNQDGTWEPRPINCKPLCGVPNIKLTPTILNGTAADITEFPWHASIYRQQNILSGSKEFICGATIIQKNLLLTAAHCVYDDTVKEVEIPEKFYVATGNRFRDYDSPLHQPRVVQKSAVKNIYVPCTYHGFEGNYGSDIALIELREPFQLSNVLMPACVDVLGANEQILEAGSVGKFAGFGGTATGMTSALLLTTNITLVSYQQCREAKSSARNVGLISNDKICGGGSEGMAVCQGDSGGGLVFENAGSWNVMGILSVNLGPDMTMGVELPCSENSYSLYTKVSTHMAWIQNVLYHLERDQVYPSCGQS